MKQLGRGVIRAAYIQKENKVILRRLAELSMKTCYDEVAKFVASHFLKELPRGDQWKRNLSSFWKSWENLIP